MTQLRIPGSYMRGGTLSVGAEARPDGAQWVVSKALMSRSARRLMEGWVRVPST